MKRLWGVNPRWYITAAILLIAVIAINPIAHWLIERRLENALGVDVRIGSTQVWPRHSQLQLCDIEFAPHTPNASPLTIEQLWLSIDKSQLLEHRLHVKYAVIEGIEFGEPAPHKEISHALASGNSTPPGTWLPKHWFGNENSAGVPTQVHELAVSKLAQKLQGEWDQQRNEVLRTGETVRQDVEKMRREITDLQNRLRDIPKAEASIEQAQNLREQLASIRKNLDGLPERLRKDLQELNLARQSDLQKLAELLDVQPESTHRLANELIQQHAHQQVMQWLPYVEVSQGILAQANLPAAIATERGENIHFGTNAPFPELFLQRAAFEGSVRVKNRAHPFVGQIHNLSSMVKTDHVGPPLIIRGKLSSGVHSLLLDLRHRDNGRVASELITMQSEAMGGGQGNLKADPFIQLHWNGSPTTLWTQWSFFPDGKVDARLLLKQSKAKFELDMLATADGPKLTPTADDPILALDHVNFDIKIEGTLDQPIVAAQSNLTDALAESLLSSFRQQLNHRKEQLRTAIQQEHDRQKEQLNLRAQRDQDDLSLKIVELNAQVDGFTTLVARQLGLNPQSLMSKVPSDAKLR